MSLYDDMLKQMGNALGGYYNQQLTGRYSNQQSLQNMPENERQKMIQRLYDAAEAARVAEMAKTAEGKVKDKVRKALDDLDVYYTMPVTGGYGNAGVPDFVACVQGRFFGIECKAGKNTTTALQEKHLSDIRGAGGVSLVIDETNVDNVTALILANLGENR